MELYFAPMEGITTYLYRRIHAEMFPGTDRYYAPFLAPDGQGNCRNSSLRDVLPENNTGVDLVPQILCNRPEAFLCLARLLADMGYREVNLNVGCPSSTVVPKHKGAGMLLDLNSLDDFLAEVFSRCPLRISVKTRLGLESTAEFPAVLEIYNRYPIHQLIIHARDRNGMYKSTPDLAAFAAAYRESRAPVCYNGNLVSPESLQTVLAATPELSAAMLGRGAVTDPALFRRLRGGAPLCAEEFAEFLRRLEDAFLSAGIPESYTLARLKEIWFYTIHMFPDSPKGAKAINKAQSLADYHAAANLLLQNNFSSSAAFSG
ncbi:MAG: tRNA-dihydrouridine synthase family protein [Oscillospiraceae bacterium]|nr:tRNA-dihydrouridine synthase family protein [Oscillospiraceae bacterium]